MIAARADLGENDGGSSGCMRDMDTPTGQGTIAPNPACVISARADLGERAGRRRRLPVKVEPPTDQGAVALQPASMKAARADLRKAERFERRRGLCVVVTSPAGHRAVGL